MVSDSALCWFSSRSPFYTCFNITGKGSVTLGSITSHCLGIEPTGRPGLERTAEVEPSVTPFLVGVARGGPGVPVTPLCKPFLSKQPTIYRGENAMTILFDPV